MLLLAALGVAFLAYGGALAGGFVFDDVPLLVATDCHSPRELPKIVGPVLEELHRRVSTPKLARLLSGTPNRLLTAE